jgi:hypothetical protein
MADLINKVIAERVNDVLFYMRDLGYTLNQALARTKAASTLGPASWEKVIATVNKSIK